MQGKGNNFNYDHFLSKKPKNPYEVTFSDTGLGNITCICGNYNESRILECSKCKNKVHFCLKGVKNRQNYVLFQCLACVSKDLDLIYEPKRILIETFYQTKNIYENENLFSFEFDLDFQDTQRPLDIRGLKPNKEEISWPMQGIFYFNGDQKPLKSIKPLLANSNRKKRQETYFVIDKEHLKLGRNVITFKIPQLNCETFSCKFQSEVESLYFIGIYSTKVLSVEECLEFTLKSRRHEKTETIKKLGSSLEDDIEVENQKINLIDIYSGSTIKMPVRGKYCEHLTPICLHFFLMYQRSIRNWKCPICPQYLNEPYVDMWLYQIIKSNPGVEQVKICINGTYSIEKMINIQDSQSQSSSHPVENQIQSRKSGQNSELSKRFDLSLIQQEGHNESRHQNSNYEISPNNPNQQVDLIQIEDDDRHDLQFQSQKHDYLFESTIQVMDEENLTNTRNYYNDESMKDGKSDKNDKTLKRSDLSEQKADVNSKMVEKKKISNKKVKEEKISSKDKNYIQSHNQMALKAKGQVESKSKFSLKNEYSTVEKNERKELNEKIDRKRMIERPSYLDLIQEGKDRYEAERRQMGGDLSSEGSCIPPSLSLPFSSASFSRSPSNLKKNIELSKNEAVRAPQPTAKTQNSSPSSLQLGMSSMLKMQSVPTLQFKVMGDTEFLKRYVHKRVYDPRGAVPESVKRLFKITVGGGQERMERLIGR